MKLTDYQPAYYGELGKMIGDLNKGEKFYLIPAPVAEAVDKVLDAMANTQFGIGCCIGIDDCKFSDKYPCEFCDSCGFKPLRVALAALEEAL